MLKKLINPENLYDASPNGMSQAVVDLESSLAFISGQVDWDDQLQVSSNTVAGQFESALKKLEIALKAAGATVDSILQVRIYIRGEIEDHAESGAQILSAFFGKSRPAITVLGVASLASKATLVEIEAIARVVE